jgi:hypothetical protein
MVEELIKQRPQTPVRTRETEDFGPHRVGRPVVIPSAARKVAQIALNKQIEEERENVAKNS